MRAVDIRNLHPRLQVPRTTVTRAITCLDTASARFLGGCPPGALSIAFLTDAAIARIHGEFMNDPSPTDVITFAGPPDPAGDERNAGEICICVDTAAAFVGARDGRIVRAIRDRFAEELTLYLVHGWLHLAGYDDLQPEKKRRMRGAEKRALTLLRRDGLVPAFRLR
ncbi:MAG TPA: rRNA maturation RNase YbeY [Candidatus Didemnitutus sp.]|jgi:probable rRNA maturation factor